MRTGATALERVLSERTDRDKKYYIGGCTLEWNPGNHFREPDVRTAKGFCWVMGQKISF